MRKPAKDGSALALAVRHQHVVSDPYLTILIPELSP
jgi:hypothetical protein